MNKLEGLYELKALNIPTVEWKQYQYGTKLDNNYLWTIRTAVYNGPDLNLPRLFGQDSYTSQKFADQLLEKIGDNGIVIYYPYLLAKKSGNLQFSKSRIIIEAVKGDLSSLLNGLNAEVTYIWEGNERKAIGDEHFLDYNEQDNVLSYVEYLRKKYSKLLLMGNEMQLEFSFAYNCSKAGEKIGEAKLVFFEIRTV